MRVPRGGDTVSGRCCHRRCVFLVLSSVWMEPHGAICPITGHVLSP